MSERRKLETALNKAASTPPPTLGQQTFPPGARDDLAGRPLSAAVAIGALLSMRLRCPPITAKAE